jgi:hypothetical protein
MNILNNGLNYLDVSCLGLDLGHGETALTSLLVSRHAFTMGGTNRTSSVNGCHPTSIEILPGAKSIVTAYALDAAGKALIGEDAFEEDGGCIDIGFKGRPDGREQRIEAFLHHVFGTINHRGVYSWDVPTLLVVGRPSGWKKEKKTLAGYEQIIARALQWVKKTNGTNAPLEAKVIAESRAAFLFMRDFSNIPANLVRSRVLILDLGSSTTDWTMVKDLRALEDAEDGRDLGAFLIDKYLLEISLESLNRPYADKLRDNSSEYNKALLNARKVKELYFSKPDKYAVRPATSHIDALLEDGSCVEHKIKLDATIAKRLLEAPMAELGGRTWPQIAARNTASRICSFLPGVPAGCLSSRRSPAKYFPKRWSFSTAIRRSVFPAV